MNKKIDGVGGSMTGKPLKFRAADAGFSPDTNDPSERGREAIIRQCVEYLRGFTLTTLVSVLGTFGEIAAVTNADESRFTVLDEALGQIEARVRVKKEAFASEKSKARDAKRRVERGAQPRGE